jgi:epoxide hydrolase-like predicted phosphatase
MIKALVFDVGGVLVRTVDWRGRQKWEESLGLDEYTTSEIVFHSDMGLKAQKGEISNEQLWTWIGGRLRLAPDRLAEFKRDFWSGDRLDVELVALIRRLRPRCQTAVISNATDALRQNLSERYAIADAFDLIVCSAEEHLMKPDPEIFTRTLMRLGRAARETVFVDDSEANVRAASNLGMHSIHFSADIDLAAELARLGVASDDYL